MADLKTLFGQCGFYDIATYIQSGNVVFSAGKAKSNAELAATIEHAIGTTFHFDVPVIVRTANELRSSAESNPFCSNQADLAHLHLTFLKDVPPSEYAAQTKTLSFLPDQFSIIGKDVFIKCQGQYHTSKLTNNFFEKMLHVPATTRNWKTVIALLELCKNT